MKIRVKIKNKKAASVKERANVPFFMKTAKEKPLSSHKKEVLDELRKAVEEMNLIKAGKKKAIPARNCLSF